MVLILIASACDSNPSSDGTLPLRVVDPFDPCSLLSSEEVAEALEMEVHRVAEADSHPDSDGRTVPLCVYETGHPYDSVAIQLEAGVTASDFEMRHDRDPINTVRIDGVGDDAFIHAGASVAVLVNQEVVDISLQKFGRDEVTDTVLLSLARKAESALRE